MKYLKLAWRKWMSFAKVIGNFNGQVMLTIFYLIILFPLGLILRSFQDPLNMRKKNEKSNFSKWNYKTEDLKGARRQY